MDPEPEVKDLCELIDIAPMAAVDLLDMLTTAPKADELGGGRPGAAAPVGKRCHGCFLVICSMVKDRSNWVDCCYHLFTYLEPISPPKIFFWPYASSTNVITMLHNFSQLHDHDIVSFWAAGRESTAQSSACQGASVRLLFGVKNNVMWKKDEIKPHFFMIQPKKWGDPYMGWSVFRCFCC